MTSIAFPRQATTGHRRVNAMLDMIGHIAESRLAFALTVAFAACLIWASPRPPMIDLPQHVAQITLWRDLILGQSPWADLFRINLLTPYLIGYGLALPLAFVMPALTAVKIILTIAFVAFVVSCVQLSREVGADKRLDWLFIPGFFGFAYDWGFYTFLIAAPLAVQFMRFAWRHAETADRRAAAWIVGLGCALLFSHGLMFLFAGLVGGLLLLTHAKSTRAFAIGTLPYVVLAVACGAFYFVSISHDEAMQATQTDWNLLPTARVLGYLISVQARAGFGFVPLTLVLLALPWLAGLRWRRLAAVPFAAHALVMFLAPTAAASTDFVTTRFGLFTLPFFALAFAAADGHRDLLRHRLALFVLVGVCWLCLAVHFANARAYAAGNVHFENVLAAAEPGKRAARLIADPGRLGAGRPDGLRRLSAFLVSGRQARPRRFQLRLLPPPGRALSTGRRPSHGLRVPAVRRDVRLEPPAGPPVRLLFRAQVRQNPAG